MFLRLVSLFAVIAYLGGQMLTLPHAHGECAVNMPVEHDSLPHFHVASSDEHEHSHNHEHCHRGHSHDAEKHSGQDEHDSDAVYVSSDFVSLSPSSSTDWSGDLLVDSVYLDTTFQQIQQYAISPAYALNAGETTPSQPLWLSLRALRI